MREQKIYHRRGELQERFVRFDGVGVKVHHAQHAGVNTGLRHQQFQPAYDIGIAAAPIPVSTSAVMPKHVTVKAHPDPDMHRSEGVEYVLIKKSSIRLNQAIDTHSSIHCGTYLAYRIGNCCYAGEQGFAAVKDDPDRVQ